MQSVAEDLFHQCALAAFVEVAREAGGWPDSEQVKRLAYRLYEDELRKLNDA